MKDKRAAMESFGTYVEVSIITFSDVIYVVYFDIIHHLTFEFIILKSMTGDPKDSLFLKKSLRGVRAIICPNVCFSRIQFFFFLLLPSTYISIYAGNMWYIFLCRKVFYLKLTT